MPSPVVAEALEVRKLLSTLVYPSSSLQPTNIERWSGTYTFQVTYNSDSKVRRSTIDDKDIKVVAPDGTSRTARFQSCNRDYDHKRLYVRYKISPPNGVWDAADNGVYQVWVNKSQVRDINNNPTRLKLLGTFTVLVPNYPSDEENPPPLPPLAVDVADFLAFPDDGDDDTAEIQAALDSLPMSNGIPAAGGPIGGYVVLHAGRYDLSGPLRMRSSQWLRGVGDTTILSNTSTDPNSSAIFLHSPFPHGNVMGTQVQHLRIVTNQAKGIKADPTMIGDVLALRLDGLSISSGGTAIDFRGLDVYSLNINNVTVFNPGADALFLEIGRRNTAINRISGFTIEGPARAGFNNSSALMTLGGYVNVAGVTIDDIGATVVPLHVRNASGDLRDVLINTTAGRLQSGQMIRVEDSWVRFDRLDGLSSLRKINLVNSWEVYVGQAGIADGWTLSSAVQIDNVSHLSIGTAYSPGGAGVSLFGRMSYKALSSLPLPALTSRLSGQHETGPTSGWVVDVTTFGATPSDDFDDTVAIQAAIDSLPAGDGYPGISSEVGGMVIFPQGVFHTNAPIRIPSGVWLAGQGWGTSIHNTSADPSSTAFQFVNSASTGYNVGAAITNMGINTRVTSGITAESSIVNGLVDVRLFNLCFDTGGVGVDLRNVKTYHARMDTLLFREPVTTSFWLGDPSNYSADNYVIGLQIVGTEDPNFRPDKAHVVLHGETTFEDCWLELTNTAHLPLYVSGAVTIRGLWSEHHFVNLPEDVVFFAENVWKLDADHFNLVDTEHKLKFRNAINVNTGFLDISGITQNLTQPVDLDSASRLNIGTVRAIYDSGLLDDSRVKIDGVSNKSFNIYTETYSALAGANLIANPGMTSVGESPTSAWKISMGDTFGTVYGFYTVEQTPSGPRLKIVVTSNPNNRNVRLDVRLAVPSSAWGKQAIVRYRIDGPGTTLAYGQGFSYQYGTRAHGTLTAAATQTPISSATELILLLPGTVGTYYISNVGLVVND